MASQSLSRNRNAPRRPLIICPNPALQLFPNEYQNERIEYGTKDNSKLRRLLRERGASAHGDREQLIERLERTSIDYTKLNVEEINQMLKERGLKNSQLGPKEVKIARLRLNDKQDHDTGSNEDVNLYMKLAIYEMKIEDLLKKQAVISSKEKMYINLPPAKLVALAKKRNLSTTGSPKVLIKRLQNDDCKNITKDLQKLRKLHNATKPILEAQIGHPIDSAMKLFDDRSASIQGQALLDQVEQRPKKPICSYNWRNSHWADRTERQLTEICERRGMPGYGPKAAMLKWLDTGELDYEDLYVGSLEKFCDERGIRYKSNSKKDVLIKLLQGDDEKET